MSDQKSHQFRPPLYHRGERRDGEKRKPDAEQQGWDAYKKWLSRVGTKNPTERSPFDHSVYSWRGYHTWADKVRRDEKGTVGAAV